MQIRVVGQKNGGDKRADMRAKHLLLNAERRLTPVGNVFSDQDVLDEDVLENV